MSEPGTKATSSGEQPRFTVRSADDPTYDVDPGKGWILFAGIMLGIVGALNVIFGIAAVDDSRFFVRDVEFVISDLQTWGWFLIVVGAAQLLASVGVFRMSEAARWAGIAFASINIVVQFLVLPAHPVWALMVFFVDVIIIFGLLTYGGRDRHSLRG